MNLKETDKEPYNLVDQGAGTQLSQDCYKLNPASLSSPPGHFQPKGGNTTGFRMKARQSYRKQPKTKTGD